MAIHFSKYEALGNDFIVIDESQDQNLGKEPTLDSSLRQRLCHRKLGIGADGVITLLPPMTKNGSVFMHVTNSDGSVPENCGNGLRCVARFWSDSGRILGSNLFTIDTLSGPKQARVDGDFIKVELGRARIKLDLESEQIVQACASFARKFDVVAPAVVAYVDLGNYHLVIECDAIDVAQKELGPKLEKLDIFPHGVNVSFVRKESANCVALRTWERGAGATDACGSGAGASVASFIATGRIESESVAARFRNGVVSVDINRLAPLEYDVSLSGSAQKLFDGAWDNRVIISAI